MNTGDRNLYESYSPWRAVAYYRKHYIPPGHTKYFDHVCLQHLALAVIEGGKVVHVAAYGQRNVERALPLKIDTIMYGASLTKTAFAYMVLQLVEEGRLDLDASVAELLPKPLPKYDEGDDDDSDLVDDLRWQALTPRIILLTPQDLPTFDGLKLIRDCGSIAIQVVDTVIQAKVFTFCNSFWSRVSAWTLVRKCRRVFLIILVWLIQVCRGGQILLQIMRMATVLTVPLSRAM